MTGELAMDDKYFEIATKIANSSPQGIWKYLEEGIENKLIPDLGDKNRLTTSFDPDSLLYWFSGTWKSVEPKHHPERCLEHLLSANPDAVNYLFLYYEQRFKDIYPTIDFEKYRNEIKVVLSHSILDYEFLSTLTDAEVILDYSAGYGRLMRLFNQQKRWKYVAAEAIPATMAAFSVFNYHFFNSRLSSPLTNEDLNNFKLPLYTTISGLDNLASASFDCIMLVWAYSEYDEKGAELAIQNIDRLVKPSGYVYIRDIEKPITHNTDLDDWLTKKIQPSFKLEYKLDDKKRSFGQIRLYKRNN